jgi:uncharacterized alpha-E superfamily protein
MKPARAMLSRVADSLYWMSRYLERAEHTARLLDVHYNLLLDVSPEAADKRWSRVLDSLDLVAPPDAPKDATRLGQWLAFDVGNRSSIVSCVMSARENARQVREQISSEMWEQLNRMFHEVRGSDSSEMWEVQPLDFLHAVKDGCHLFHGITDSTMSHGHGWQFIQAGRFLERACAVSALVDVHFGAFPAGTEGGLDASDHLEWIGLLKSCTAFEAYCKVYTADLQAERIAEFLLLNPEFPHSVRYSVDLLQHALANIEDAAGARRERRLDRLAGRLRSTFDFSQIDEILSSGLHNFLEDVQRHASQIHGALYQQFIHYPVEAMLEG